jgi:tetratricopeptide (TPR) repeat protein
MTDKLAGIPVSVRVALSLAVLFLCTNTSIAGGQGSEGNVAVGPTKNAKLQDGASALRASNIEDGIELTLAGLREARTPRERRTGLSNLCAGYLMLEQLDQALQYCNDALELSDKNWRVYNNRALIYVLQRRFDEAEADLAKCEEIHPRSSATKVVRQMLLHAKNPVTPVITVDDRRGAAVVEVDNE